ncbi:hypothetical protein ACFWN2_04955 [Lentzea sp. NPDC058436]|uniref:hypothetical protein n=1 Tax=Lentzea sp. NPDC058436 TaxID=3346499 RepID=UPI00364D2B4F
MRLADVALSRLPVGPGPCGTSKPVQVDDTGKAVVQIDRGGEVRLSLSDKRFGDLDGDGNDEMAVRVACSYEGGNLVFGIAFLVFASTGQDVRRIGLVDVQEDQDVQRRGRVEDIVFKPGEVVTDERWFAPEDANCCPSTYMTTTWKLENGLLVSQPRQ